MLKINFQEYNITICIKKIRINYTNLVLYIYINYINYSQLKKA